MENTCTVYIDEAGDLGVNRGTQWFILTAVIVNSDDEIRLREIIKSINVRILRTSPVSLHITMPVAF